MAQTEVYEWLKERRLIGDNQFFSIHEISRAVDSGGGYSQEGYRSVRVAVNRLYAFGYLEVEREKWFTRRWRLYEKYIKQ